MKTRIDVISGYAGSGKSELIRLIMTASGDSGRAVAYQRGDEPDDTTAATLTRIIRREQPNRIFLESVAPLEEFHQLFTWDGLVRQAYAGTQALVLDGASLVAGPAARRAYDERQLRNADVVFVNRAGALAGDGKLAVLKRVWEINRHVQLAVEPFHGIDLLKILDLPAFRHFEKNVKTKIYRRDRYVSCVRQS
jgi:G3E family GTPase